LGEGRQVVLTVNQFFTRPRGGELNLLTVLPGTSSASPALKTSSCCSRCHLMLPVHVEAVTGGKTTPTSGCARRSCDAAE
jgi:hypothetical protein